MDTNSKDPSGPALMAAAAAEAARVVAGVPGHPMDAPTPCDDWDLRTLVNHVILWTAYSAERRAHGESVAEDLMTKDFTADPGFAQDYAAQIDRAVTAWSDPAAWERELGVMGSGTPAADVAAMLIAEMVLHGWDIAKATGQPFDLPEHTLHACLDHVAKFVPNAPNRAPWRPPAAVAPGATLLNRIVAITGRAP